ncbi:unnamed protein product [Discula destructiva]
MFTSPAKLITAVAVLYRAVYAIPAPEPTPAPALELRAEATDVWISVDKTGLPSTVTPVVTVSDGVPTTLSGIPIELTATVVTRTAWGELTTSTGTAPALPTADNKKGKGSFLVCSNADGDYSPFCEPTKNSSLYAGTTYYVTWDSSVLTNTTTVSVVGTYLNSTTGEAGDTAFTSDEIKAKWSYYAWTPNSGYLSHGTGKAVNVTLALNALSADGDDITKTYTGPTVLVTKAPSYQQPAPTVPSGAALYIALPTVLGFCLVMVFGVCLWNRKTRKIGLGNVMSRSRHGYGLAKSRAKRMTMTMKGGVGGRKAKKQAAAMENIRMLENLPEDQIYRDEPAQFDGERKYKYDRDAQELKVGGGGRGRGRGHARTHSEGLDSLAAESPTDGRVNVFREEMDRQQRHR